MKINIKIRKKIYLRMKNYNENKKKDTLRKKRRRRRNFFLE